MTEKKNTIALVGMILSICGIITCGLSSIVGVILSIIGAVKSKKLNGDGKAYSIAGIVVGTFIILLMFLIISFSIFVVVSNKSIYKVIRRNIEIYDKNYNNYYEK